MVPNLSVEDSKIKSTTPLRNGRLCNIPVLSNTAPAKIRILREGSLGMNGTKLFNALPKHIRNLTNVSLLGFKKNLDEFLSTIADEPLSSGYTAGRRAESNSLIHMIPACCGR